MKRVLSGLLMLAALCFCAGAQAETARVVRGAIDAAVFGSGEILPASQPGVYAQIDAEVVDWYVGMGDRVKAGDVLMKLENDALADDIAQLEYEIQLAQEDVLYTRTHTQYKFRQLHYEDDGRPRFDVNTGEPLMEKYSDEITIRCPCDGRVMAVYIELGDDALAVYREYGSVVMLSTDGRMKVVLESDDPLGLELDQTVMVRGAGIYAEAKVVDLKRYGTQAVIQVEGDSYAMNTPVSVLTTDDELIGKGILEINKPMPVSAYGGTIKGLAWNVVVGKYLKRYDVIARIDWDETPLYYDNDKVLWAYSKAKTQLEKARDKEEQLSVVAPCDGWIASIDVKKGDSVTDGTRLMSLVEDAGMQLTLKVDELDIPKVRPGQSVTISVDALPDVTLAGVVDRIAPLGNTENSVTTYDVYVELSGETDERVLGGMNVSGEIVVSSAENALLIPAQALTKRGGVWTVQMENGELREVETGVMTDGQVQILSGLAEGETVVY